MARILYIGKNSSNATSEHRARALERLGHEVFIVDPYREMGIHLNGKYRSAFHYKTGYRLLQKVAQVWINSLVEKNPFYDAIWIDSGELFGKKCISILKNKGYKVVLYNIDDPTGKRDGQRFASLKKAIPFYNLIVVVRTETKIECENLGGKKVIRVFRSYDEDAHKVFEEDSDYLHSFKSEVVFIGTWMPNERRDYFLFELIKNGIQLSIWGDSWHRSKYYKDLRPYIRGKSIYGRDYVAAIQGSKICIGMLSKGNRDLHTTRSLEIPYAGGLLCAERTEEHTKMYVEGVEAVFWKDVAECAAVCKKLLADDFLREKIKRAGAEKVRSLKVGNEDVCDLIIREVFADADLRFRNPLLV